MNIKNVQKQTPNTPYGMGAGNSAGQPSPAQPARPMPPTNARPPQPESSMNKKVLWGIVVVVIVIGAFMLFSRSANDTSDVPEVPASDAAAGTVPTGIMEIVVSRSADLSAHATIAFDGEIVDEIDVQLESYSDITPVLSYVVDTYGADNPTLTYQSVLEMVVFEDVSRPTEVE